MTLRETHTSLQSLDLRANASQRTFCPKECIRLLGEYVYPFVPSVKDACVFNCKMTAIPTCLDSFGFSTEKSYILGNSSVPADSWPS